MTSEATIPSAHVVVGLGEALFDRFPHRTILGGAPLNFAFHAHQILTLVGGEGVVASRIGSDEAGDQLIHELESLGMTSRHLQRDARRPTGDVIVDVGDDGETRFRITPDVAWDAMDFDARMVSLAGSCDAICFGTLAQRSPMARETIHRFLDHAHAALRVYDVNLRQNDYDESVIRASLQAATVVKLNDDELVKVCSLPGIKIRGHAPIACVQDLVKEFSLDLVALTRGARGTILVAPNQVVTSPVPSFSEHALADSVGAGDASCAGLICGLLHGWPLRKALTLSNMMGAFVASQTGATPRLSAQLDTTLRAMFASN